MFDKTSLNTTRVSELITGVHVIYPKDHADPLNVNCGLCCQAHAEMSQGDTQEQRSKEMVDNITEEQFLKDLYLFMRKRDTPIERIPHLGFKQSTR